MPREAGKGRFQSMAAQKRLLQTIRVQPMHLPTHWFVLEEIVLGRIAPVQMLQATAEPAPNVAVRPSLLAMRRGRRVCVPLSPARKSAFLLHWLPAPVQIAGFPPHLPVASPLWLHPGCAPLPQRED